MKKDQEEEIQQPEDQAENDVAESSDIDELAELQATLNSDGESEEIVEATEESEELSPRMLKLHEEVSLKAQIECLVFASQKPMKAAEIAGIVTHEVEPKEIEEILEELKEEYANRSGGFRLEFVKSLGYQFQTISEAGPMMEKLFASRPRPLSRAALETLSIIAYRQPTTRAAIEYIRGVDSGSIVKNLLERNLIRCTGRKEDAGRPMLFGTTDEFLQVFGLTSLNELPPLQSFQPENETMQRAMSELDAIEQVDVEEFVGDEEQDEPAVSDGLLVGADEMLAARVMSDDDTIEERSGASYTANLEDEAESESESAEPVEDEAMVSIEADESSERESES